MKERPLIFSTEMVKAIGIEIEENYCEIAAKRCCQPVMRLEV